MKLLVISLAGIGDTLFATPLIHELRANFPAAQIDALILWKGSQDLLEGNPHLNTIFQKNLINAGKFESLQFLLGLRRLRYDVSFNTHPQSRIHYRAVARFINARIRVSHRYECSGRLDDLLVNRSVPQDYTRHAIENNLDFLGLVGAKTTLPRHDYEFFLKPSEQQWAEEFIASNQLSGRPRLGIHIGSGGTKNLAQRRWPLDHYLALLQKLARDHPQTAVLLFGGPGEEPDHKTILARTERQQVYVPATANLRQAAALLQKCDAFLSVDTALMHLAAAMKVPNQIVIETPTWNPPIAPYQNSFTLLRNPSVNGKNLDYYRYDGRGIRGSPADLQRCMASVTVDNVFQVLTKILRQTA